jgi:hypothetical protein
MGRDSNPRYLAVNTLSKRAHSTTLPPIQVLGRGGTLLLNNAGGKEGFRCVSVAHFLCHTATHLPVLTTCPES